MPRPKPSPAPAVILATRESLLEISATVVTPMFGGGGETGKIDPLVPIRGPSVRGQLRFWWRACNAHRYDSAEELFVREAEIWGMSHRENDPHAPSSIDIAVEIKNPGTTVEFNDKRFPAYALWPYEQHRNQGRIDIECSLTLAATPRSPLAEDELRHAAGQAVWAWLTFGGIGARTRRGCGTLQCSDRRFCPPDGDIGAVLAWIAERRNHFVTGDAVTNHAAVPVLAGGKIGLLGRRANELDAWREAVDLMRDFRQGAGVGRTRQFGASRWPEADSIRELTGDNRPQSVPVHLARPYFPRADLGLPIQFKFMDHDQGDPETHTLSIAEKGATRMASPVILKALPAGNGAYPLALLLNAPFLADLGVGIELDPQGALSMPQDIADTAKAGRVDPLTDFTSPGARDARSAFFGFIAERRGATVRDL